MCPSYRATGEEQHSTRGRAHLLWEMLSGALRQEGFQSRAVHEALDLCLSCKACKSECPVQVDMAAYKSEFLAQRYKGRLHPLHHYIFGFADRFARYGSLAPALTNAILTGPITSPLIKRIAGIASERQLPRLAPKSFQKARAYPQISSKRLPHRRCRKQVPVLSGPTPGTTTTIRNRLPPPNPSSPRPASASKPRAVTSAAAARSTTSACSRAARAYLAQVLRHMAPQIDAGLPFVFLEPSCASVFKDELLELFPNDPRARRLSEQVWLFADFLAARAPGFAKDRLTAALGGAHILLHGHCHHKAVFGGPGNEIALLRQAGADGRTHRGRLLRHGRALRFRSR